MVEATSFKNGVVVAQVNQVVERVPRVDIPGDRVHFVVEAGRPFHVEPLFTRDPGAITETQILTAMLAIKGIYAPYGVTRLNHGIGFNTAAIELLAADLWRAPWPERQDCDALGAQPAPDADPRRSNPAGSSRCTASARRSEWMRISAPGRTSSSPDRTARCGPTVPSARPPGCMPATCSSARRCRSTSPATPRPSPQRASRGSAARPTWAAIRAAGVIRARPGCRRDSRPTPARRQRCVAGRKLVVQIGETFGENNAPLFVETLDALALAEDAGSRTGGR